MSQLSAAEGRHAILAETEASSYPAGRPSQETGFLRGFEVIDLPDTFDAGLILSPQTVLVILETEVLSPPLHCVCLRCQERHLAFPTAPPQSPLGIHVLFQNLGRRTELWEWVRLQLRERARRVALCDHSQAHRLWAAHRLDQHPSRRGTEASTLHLW